VLQSLTDGSRGSLANIRVAVGNLTDYPDMEAEIRERFVGIISDEVLRMSQRLDQTMSEFADSLKTRWPLEDVLGIDIIAAAQRRIEEQLKLPSKTEESRRSLVAASRELLAGVLDLFPGITPDRTLSDQGITLPASPIWQTGLSGPHLGRARDVIGDFLHLGNRCHAGGRRVRHCRCVMSLIAMAARSGTSVKRLRIGLSSALSCRWPPRRPWRLERWSMTVMRARSITTSTCSI
jgi:hypothetical protein